MRTWKTLNPRRILHAPSLFSLHGGLYGVPLTSLEPGPFDHEASVLLTERKSISIKWLVGWMNE